MDSTASLSQEEATPSFMLVESEDIPPSPTSGGGGRSPFSLQQIWQTHVQPATELVAGCTNTAYLSCVGSAREELELQLPGLLQEVRRGGNRRTVALQKIYRLTDREHRENR